MNGTRTIDIELHVNGFIVLKKSDVLFLMDEFNHNSWILTIENLREFVKECYFRIV